MEANLNSPSMDIRFVSGSYDDEGFQGENPARKLPTKMSVASVGSVSSPAPTKKYYETKSSFFIDSVGFAQLPVEEKELERRRELVNDLKKKGSFKGTGVLKIDDIILRHPEFASALEKFDTNQDGQIDTDELVDVLADLSNRKQQVELFKKLFGFSVIFLLVLLLCNTLLTVWMLKLNKDVYVDSSSNSLTSSNGEILKSEKPKFYTSIAGISSLPAAALDSITRLTFTTVDGGVYNLLVDGKSIAQSTAFLTYR